MSTPSTAAPVFEQVDSRAPRFTATITAAVLIGVLVVSRFSTPAAAILLGAQSLAFAIGALLGPKRHPYGLIFDSVIAPRLGPVTKREGVPPLRFAQLVGFIFTGIGVAGFACRATLLGVIATAVALTGAFVRAAFGICLSRRLFALIAHLRGTELRSCCKGE